MTNSRVCDEKGKRGLSPVDQLNCPVELGFQFPAGEFGLFLGVDRD